MRCSLLIVVIITEITRYGCKCTFTVCTGLASVLCTMYYVDARHHSFPLGSVHWACALGHVAVVYQ